MLPVNKYAKQRFLVIDDFDQMRLSVKRMLQSLGVNDIELAYNGERAIEVLLAGPPFDVILCDYNLGPGKNGQQVLEEGRHRGLIRSSAMFIMFTAENSTSMVVGAMEFQPDDYLTKPFTRDNLRLRLDRVHERKTELRAIEEAREARAYGKAIELCDAALRQKPKYRSEIIRIKGESQLLAKDFAGAETTYQEAIAQRRLPWARLGLAKAMFHQNRYQEGAELLEALIGENRLAIEAYDWLARCRGKLADTKAAQDIIARAAKISPNSLKIRRQLGDLAFINQDVETAEQAYRTSIRLATHSYLKGAEDYSKLAKAQVAKGESDAALGTLLDGKKKLRDSQSDLHLSLVQGSLLDHLGRSDEAAAVRQHAESLSEVTLSPDDELQVASFMMQTGDTARATDLLERLVRNNHDNSEILDGIQDVFTAHGMAESGRNLIETNRDGMIAINNQGVRLVKQGRLQEAVALFVEAADGCPSNKTINLNAAQALLMLWEKQPGEKKELTTGENYLQRVGRVDPKDPKYKALLSRYRRHVA